MLGKAIKKIVTRLETIEDKVNAVNKRVLELERAVEELTYAAGAEADLHEHQMLFPFED